MPGTPLAPLPHGPAIGPNLAALIEARAAARGDAPFLIWDPTAGKDRGPSSRDVGRQWSYRAWARDVERLAAAFRARGIGHGSFVCVHLDNRPEFLLAWWALARLGAVCVSTNARSAADELRYFLEDSGARTVVTSRARRDVVADAIPCSVERIVLVDEDAQPIRGDGLICERFAALLGEGEELPPAPPCPADLRDACCVQYTSGTTSRPKGVVLTHANYVWGAEQMALHQRLTEHDVYLVQMPLFHVNAQIYSVLAAWVAGAKVVLVPGFSRTGFWEIATRHQTTVSSMIPFYVMALLRDPDGTRVPLDGLPAHAFRAWGYGIRSAKLEGRFGLKTIGWYGMTETISAPVITPWGAQVPEGAIGRAAPGYELKLLDDEGIPVPPGIPGVLQVRGSPGITLAKEYLNRPRATAAAFSKDGWFSTGDRLRFDEQGWLYFVDRDKDMLKVGGENVASSEIERVILEVPGVLDVAVVGVRDSLLDEVPVACVIAKPGSDFDVLRDAVLSHTRRKLADFKVPRRIEMLDSLPRVTLEKINKAALRERLAGDG